MGLIFRKSKRLTRNTRLNVSNRGASVSARKGPISVSSRGHVTLRLGRGFSLRIF